MKLNEAVYDVIKKSKIIDGVLFLPPTQLDRKLYLEVNNVLQNLGGKWISKKKGFVFESLTIEELADSFDTLIETKEWVDIKKELNFFPTPKNIINKMIDLSGIRNDKRLGLRLLEPSAGIGSIANMIFPYADRLDAVEINKGFFNNFELLKKEEGFSFFGEDFLNFSSKYEYDYVFMNPPFSNKRGINHIIKAFSLLKKEGILVAIIDSGALSNIDQKSKNFQRLVHENWISLEHLPAGSFSDSGTNVNTSLIVLKKK